MSNKNVKVDGNRTGAHKALFSVTMFINWLLSPDNLPRDRILHQFMDKFLRISVDVILSMQRVKQLGMVDRTQLLMLLKQHSMVMHVDEPTGMIRPIWAVRSILVLENVVPGADVHDVMFLMGHPTPTSWNYSPDGYRSIPSLPVPFGLQGLCKLTDTVWIAVFNHKEGAKAAIPNTRGKTMWGVAPNVYVHEERAWDCVDEPRNLFAQHELLLQYREIEESVLRHVEEEKLRKSSDVEGERVREERRKTRTPREEVLTADENIFGRKPQVARRKMKRANLSERRSPLLSVRN